ncbi:MAG: hypothetical protein AMK73_03230 [Planctomycetes bacterium SM23_32]|nr:MAG: hypothetical protein AMK73_03230 [Planctomycetes bacterium SM23_32]
MTDLSHDALCLVGLCATDGVGPATVARLRAAARVDGVPLARVLELPLQRLESEIGLTAATAATVASLPDAAAAGRGALEWAAGAGYRVCIATAADYPTRLGACLGESAPAVLFVAGDLSLLGGPCVAVVGSRRPSPTAAEAARGLARRQAAAGFTVVSGAARGIDRIAHAAAVQAGGTALVPAVGVARFRWPAPGQARGQPGGWCVVGQFPPNAPWRAAQALMRNRTVAALSDAVVAFEPRDCGGTWHTSNTALALGRPLFVVSGSRHDAKGRGLSRLVRLGAIALDPGRMPDAEELAQLTAQYRPPRSAAQLGLFDGQEP